MIAICQIRQDPHYRREAFERGLQKAGYRLVQSARPAGAEDLLVIWNRYGGREAMADTWERCGGTVLVCENGYIGRDAEGRQYYAISAHGHNGSGWWPVGYEDRWSQLKIELRPWHLPNERDHLLVCGQRGIGSKSMASPNGWHDHTAARLKQQSDRPIKVRLHPGTKPPATLLEDDLRSAHACVIWSSGSGVKALVLGYPVFYDAPHWICENSATPLQGASLELPKRDDSLRLAALKKMAFAQWSVAEIESGEPFVRFLAHLQKKEVA